MNWGWELEVAMPLAMELSPYSLGWEMPGLPKGPPLTIDVLFEANLSQTADKREYSFANNKIIPLVCSREGSG